MLVFDTSIDVKAPPAVCWRTLLQTGEYSLWNPVVRAVEGSIALNATVFLRLKIAGSFAISTPVLVDTLDEQLALRWSSKNAPSLLRVEHSFLLSATAAGTTFRNLETFAGPLPSAAAPLLRRIMPERYLAFNESFKRHCERAT